MSVVYSGTFEILPPPSISVTGPSGTLYVGDIANITWISTGTVGNVKIQLYRLSTLITTLTSSTSNDGSYSWTIKTSDLVGWSSLYRIKISETDGDPTDYGSFFTIFPYNLDEPTDSASISESVASATHLWQTARSIGDSISFTTDSATTEKRSWKTIKAISDSTLTSETVVSQAIRRPVPVDSASISETVAKPVRQWKKIRSVGDSAKFDDTVDYWFNRPKAIEDSVTITERTTDSTREWKKIHTKSDSVTLLESLNYWLHSTLYINDSTAFTESVADSTRQWKKIYTIADSTLLTETLVPQTRTWKQIKIIADSASFPTDIAIYTIGSWQNIFGIDSIDITEELDTDTRIWKHLKVGIDSTLLTQNVDAVKKPWKRFYNDSTAFSADSITTLIKPWKRFADNSTQFTVDSVATEIKQWHHIIDEVISFTENVSDVFGENPNDTMEFFETITTAIFRSCNVRKFEDPGTEVFGGFRRSGWFITSKRGDENRMIRRLNVEYNSADPLDFKIYIDGDDTNHVFLTTLPAATGVETTNKSVRVGRRAKNFMLEVSSAESTSTNVKIEDIEIEVDEKRKWQSSDK